jgi:hypothetical protein
LNRKNGSLKLNVMMYIIYLFWALIVALWILSGSFVVYLMTIADGCPQRKKSKDFWLTDVYGEGQVFRVIFVVLIAPISLLVGIVVLIELAKYSYKRQR